MRLSHCLPALALLALVAVAPGARAFTSAADGNYPSAATATPLADPEDIANDMASGQSTGVAVVNTLGGATLDFAAPSGGGLAGSPFVADPAMSTVPSKQEGW
jgi:hypothetical protein